MFRKLQNRVEKLLANRLLAMAVLFAVLFLVLVCRLFVIQIVQGQSHKEDFTYKVEKTVKTSGTRGNIYDCNGKLLAYNKMVYTVNFQNDNKFKTLAQENDTSENYEKNKVIYEVIKILEKNKDSFKSDIPIEITGNGTFRFTEKGSRLERFKREAFGIGTDTKGLSKERLKLRQQQLNASAEEVFEYLRNGTMGSPGVGKMFDIDEKYSDKDALKIMSVRYSAYLSRYSQYMKVTFATEVSSRSIAEIEERSNELTGIDVSTKSIRVYKNSEAMSHVIGYTGTINTEELDDYNKGKKESDKDYYAMDDAVGKAGIEKELESYLHGSSGSQSMIVNNIGKIVKTTKTEKAGTGNNVVLSIDSDLQEYAYNLLERRITGIVLSKLTTSDSKGDRSNIRIPIKDVYYSLIGNSIVDITDLNGERANSYEKSMYKKIQSLKKDSIKTIRKNLTVSTKAYKDESEEKQNYADYVYKMLSRKKVLLTGSIDTKDKTYLRWKDEKIGLGEFLKYAINKEWIDISMLDLPSKYSDTEQIFDALVSYVEEQLEKDDEFDLTVCEQKIGTGELSGRSVCLLLYEQGVLNKKKDAGTYQSLKNGSLDAYSFIRQKLSKREITPAQLGLDPCSGSIVITDPDTGKVKAMVSYPGYDSNKLSNGIDNDYYRQLSNSTATPLYNQVLNHRTAPGSTFKPLSAITALNEGTISTGTQIQCTGVFDKISPAAHCWIYPNGRHGYNNVAGALEVSCNCFFYEVGYDLGMTGASYSSKKGLEALKKYATKIGLNKKSGIELSEMAPHISDETSVRSAIGQGTNSFTPSQISNYVTTLSNKGTVYDLSILDKVTTSGGKTVKKYGVKKKSKLTLNDDSYWDAVWSGMRRVVSGKKGAVTSIFKGLNVKVAGKTGTAQEDKKRPNHALFISFGPYEDPEITVTAVIPYGYTSSNAAAAAKDLYKYYFANDKEKAKLRKDKKVISAAGSVSD